MLKLAVNAEARRFSEPGAGIPHAGIFGGAGGQLPVLRYLRNYPHQERTITILERKTESAIEI